MKKIDVELSMLLSRIDIYLLKDISIDKSYIKNKIDEESQFDSGEIMFVLQHPYYDNDNVARVIFYIDEKHLSDTAIVEFKVSYNEDNEIDKTKKKKKKGLKKRESLQLLSRVVLKNYKATELYKLICHTKVKDLNLRDILLEYI